MGIVLMGWIVEKQIGGYWKMRSLWWPCMRKKNRKECMKDKWKDE